MSTTPSTNLPRRLPTPPPPVSQQNTTQIAFAKVPERKGHKLVLFGTGGIGKTSLAHSLPGVSATIDADESLAILQGQLKARGIKLPHIVPATNWRELRAALQASGWSGVQNVILDTTTKAEEWATAFTCQNVPNDKGKRVSGVEDYGFGKGFQYVYDTFLNVLGDLDKHVREGRNVVLIAHECTANVPNPTGEDYLRYEPRLQSPNSGKASIRHRVKEWADHVLFLGYDIAVSEDGKATGQGTRTLYTAERPFCMAKSRTTSEQINVGEPQDFDWSLILK